MFNNAHTHIYYPMIDLQIRIMYRKAKHQLTFKLLLTGKWEFSLTSN